MQRQKLLGKKVTCQFQTTLPHIQTQKFPKTHTHTHTQRGKITVTEIPKTLQRLHTHTHT